MNRRRYQGAGITQVCIDSYENGVLTGRIYNSRLGEAGSFQSMVEFLNRMEQLLAIEDSPQHFNRVRSFQPVISQLPDSSAITMPRVGKLATLELHILFRQNSSWQGSILWTEGKQEQHFRSVLELIFLMDSALGGAKTTLSNEYPA